MWFECPEGHSAKNKGRAVTGVGSGAAVDQQGERALPLYGSGCRTPQLIHTIYSYC